MARPHGTDIAGTPVDLIGQPLTPGVGAVNGITIVKRSTDEMTNKADTDGIYALGDARYVIRKGDPLPEGAEMDVAPEVEPDPVLAQIEGVPVPGTEGIHLDAAGGNEEFITAVAEGDTSELEFDENLIHPDDVPKGMKVTAIEADEKAAPAARGKGAAPENRAKAEKAEPR